jgi:GrpB-like predicted nucleotidyltransferase (UPF0157 family)
VADPGQPRRGPTTEERLRRNWVVEPPRLTARIQVVDHDPRWPGLFRREADRIRALLGERALRLEHIGSTSVPELAAKPIIDILLVVADPADEPAYLPDLKAAGYVLVIREPEWFQHRCLKGPDTDVNLHVHPPDSPEIERSLLFRERLRASPEDRVRYQRAKRELARRDWTYVQEYADAKTEVIEEIIARARAAASAAEGGPPGPVTPR